MSDTERIKELEAEAAAMREALEEAISLKLAYRGPMVSSGEGCIYCGLWQDERWPIPRHNANCWLPRVELLLAQRFLEMEETP